MNDDYLNEKIPFIISQPEDVIIPTQCDRYRPLPIYNENLLPNSMACQICPEGDSELIGWINPSDSVEGSVNFITVLHKILICVTAAVAVYAIITSIYVKSLHPFWFWYLVVSMTSELIVWLIVGLTILIMTIIIGPFSLTHSAAMCGILLQVIEGIIIYTAVGVGCWALYTYFDENTPWAVKLYIVLEIVLSFFYTVRVAPVIWGVINFLFAEIKKAIVPHESPFTNRDARLWFAYYTQPEIYDASIACMSNPTIPRLPDIESATNLPQVQRCVNP